MVEEPGSRRVAAPDKETLSFGSRRRSRTWARPVLVAAVLAAGAGVGVLLLRPDPLPPPRAVAAVGGAGWTVTTDRAAHRSSFTFELRSTVAGPVTITGVGRSARGLQLLRTRARPRRDGSALGRPGGAPLPISVGRSSLVAVTLVYHVIGCPGLRGRSWPIPVTYQVGGSRTRTTMIDPGGGSFELAWHDALTHRACGD